MFVPLTLAMMFAAETPHAEEPPVHAHERVSCPLHVHNLVGIRAIGVAAFEQGAGRDAKPEGGFGVAYERTLVPRWFELEVSFNTMFTESGPVLPLDIVFKKPFHLSHRFDPFVGLGGIVAFGVGEESFVAPGLIASAGMYVWAGRRWGASAEVDYAALREPEHWIYELEFAAGPVLRF
ncbi:MAG: hypothetical protein AAGA54_24000 [Myxococcota bacterium]